MFHSGPGWDGLTSTRLRKPSGLEAGAEGCVVPAGLPGCRGLCIAASRHRDPIGLSMKLAKSGQRSRAQIGQCRAVSVEPRTFSQINDSPIVLVLVRAAGKKSAFLHFNICRGFFNGVASSGWC